MSGVFARRIVEGMESMVSRTMMAMEKEDRS
jgi:hypothetical protein